MRNISVCLLLSFRNDVYSSFVFYVLGIGVPAVALSGASAANGMISPWKQWVCLDDLKASKLI